MASEITIGGGRFWLIEAAFRHLWGVSDVVCGYAGGDPDRTTPAEIASCTTGHAEVVNVHYDTQVLDTRTLLDVFFVLHDPTEYFKDDDISSQYRSIIFYHNDEQKVAAQTLIADLIKKKAYGNRLIFTEIAPFENFFPAEEYHQNFYKKNPDHEFCKHHIKPILAKFKKVFKEFYIN
jgi:peptide-methionine (S)-S-oxide reductase